MAPIPLLWRGFRWRALPSSAPDWIQMTNLLFFGAFSAGERSLCHGVCSGGERSLLYPRVVTNHQHPSSTLACVQMGNLPSSASEWAQMARPAKPPSGRFSGAGEWRGRGSRREISSSSSSPSSSSSASSSASNSSGWKVSITWSAWGMWCRS